MIRSYFDEALWVGLDDQCRFLASLETYETSLVSLKVHVSKK